ncbi:hypothetical protein PGT21_005438 [Puccinia graminis f. sp. tritici]|uniref:Uncharacterized protein n=1 Tax=Puccinia graminis f. sp. tritici TaxID=56615 RepID=A0A5B0NSN0_PUCGR|nr:hypothetical protein PGT21_005438 [Puccinia graminis f. sp. tritici]KAA1091702.1 hypothetical protein PGTUg99_009606 [Puccinia graminis f. sp. tritici]
MPTGETKKAGPTRDASPRPGAVPNQAGTSPGGRTLNTVAGREAPPPAPFTGSQAIKLHIALRNLGPQTNCITETDSHSLQSETASPVKNAAAVT